MRISWIMAAVRKAKPPPHERAPSAGQQGKQRASVRAFQTNSSPIYKTQSDTSLNTRVRNLTIRDNKSNVQNKRLFSRGSGTTKVHCLTDVADLIKAEAVQNVVVVAGAGISTSSGIPDFRSPGTGLYDNLQQYRIPYPEAIFDIEFFHFNPRPFFTLAKELYPTGKYRPNYIHYFVRMLHDKGMLLRMYTQNIDGLERLAGIPAEKLVEAHGTFASATCCICSTKHDTEEVREKIFADKLPKCKNRGCVGIVKPDIVFFGEDLPRKFYSYLKDMLQTDLVLVLGTSLEVQPFAGIIDTVRWNVPRVLFNRNAVGPFKYSKRSQDVVAEGDLVDRIQKFSNMIGWKTEMMELITQHEGLFKTSSVPVTNTTDTTKKSETKPVRNGSQNLQREKAQLNLYNFWSRREESSSEESEDSDESDLSSSDSSEEETKKGSIRGGYRPRNITAAKNSIHRNGANVKNGNGVRNGNKNSGKEKEQEKDKVFTKRNQVQKNNSRTNVRNGVRSSSAKGEKGVGNFTERSVKSDVGFSNKKEESAKSSVKLSVKNEESNAVQKTEDSKETESEQNSEETRNQNGANGETQQERVLRKYGINLKKPIGAKQEDKNDQTNKISDSENSELAENGMDENSGAKVDRLQRPKLPGNRIANGDNSQKSKPPLPTGGKQQTRDLHTIKGPGLHALKALNARPYGYASPGRPGQRGGPFPRTTVRTVNSNMNFTDSWSPRAGSAELPAIGFRHRLQPSAYDARIFGPRFPVDSSSSEGGDSDSSDSR